MPDDKSLGSKILGLFVEPGTPADGTPSVEGGSGAEAESAADVVAELVAASGGRPQGSQAAAVAAPTSVAPGGSSARPPLAPPAGQVEPANVDFDAVFQRAGMDATDLDRVRKAEALLAGLPAATPHDIKRQIVEVSLKAVGFDIGRVAGAAESQLKALDTYVRVNEQQTAKSLTELQQQIAALDDKIIGLRADMERRTQALASLAAAAARRSEQVRTVLAFFGSQPPRPVSPAAAPQAEAPTVKK